jgi:hypothetical protein
MFLATGRGTMPRDEFLAHKVYRGDDAGSSGAMKLGAVDAQSQRFSHGPISSAMVPPLSAARKVMPTGVGVPSALR